MARPARSLAVAAVLLAAGCGAAAPPPLWELPAKEFRNDPSLVSQGGDDVLPSVAVGQPSSEARVNASLRPLWALSVPITVPTSARTLEVILLVTGHWESQLHMRLEFEALSGSTVPSGGEDQSKGASIALDKTCVDLFDECGQQHYFQYTLPPFMPSQSAYTGRLAVRAQSRFGSIGFGGVGGRWRVRISNSLPHTAQSVSVPVQLIVRSRSYSYWGIVLPAGGILFALLVCGVTLCDRFSAIIASREARHAAAAPGWDDDDDGVGGLMRTVRDRVVEGARSAQQAVAARYRRLPDLGRGRAGDSEEGGSPACGGPGGGSDDDDDDRNTCRICRCEEPASELFSPCVCSGSMKYIHRGCLEEWRQKTTNPQNRVRCSECKEPFHIAVTHEARRLAFTRAVLGGTCSTLLHLAAIEGTIMIVGTAAKGVFGVITNDLDNIVWDPFNLYHHLLALAVMTAFVSHSLFFRHNILLFVPPGVPRFVFLALSTALEIPTGYVGNLLLWCFNSTIWDWQVHYLTGLVVVVTYVLYCHDAAMRLFRRRFRREEGDGAGRRGVHAHQPHWLPPGLPPVAPPAAETPPSSPPTPPPAPHAEGAGPGGPSSGLT
eukprot:TRINITY_DN10452_c0_g1_i1.p1 TRINITY_DN10452_c0_g1~~TRINITY_DN10452_c0_g1_i1.p1  ORF type:complete len:605 (+),score=169.76 TRINITY_DN10452_c0_g1_i1:79-1893(+)